MVSIEEKQKQGFKICNWGYKICMKKQLCSCYRLAWWRDSVHQKQEGSSEKNVKETLAVLFLLLLHTGERLSWGDCVQSNEEHTQNTTAVIHSCKCGTWASPLWTFSLQPVLLCLRWYHGHLSGANAEKLLVARDEPDTFLVRESMSKPGDFVLSVLTNEKSKNGTRRVSHIKIMCQVLTQTQTLTHVFFFFFLQFELCDHTCGAQLCNYTNKCAIFGICFTVSGAEPQAYSLVKHQQFC